MIKCDIHDYVEIACMYRYQVNLLLINGQSLQGKVNNINTNSQRQECLILEVESGNQSLPLDTIKSMTAITKNPHFECVNIN